MQTDDTRIFFDASTKVFETIIALIQDLCSTNNMEFKATQTPLLHNTRYWTILCGQYNAILEDRDDLFSVRTLIRKYGTKLGQFTPVILSDRQYALLQGSDGSSTWIPNNHSGTQTDAQGIAALCLQDILKDMTQKN